MRLRRRHAHQAGFTVLEILVAFVLFAATFAVLMQVFSGGLRDAQLADEYARASQVAQSRLAAVTAGERIEEGSASGSQDGLAWNLVVTAYDELGESAEARRGPEFNLRVRLLKAESAVTWQAADGRERQVRLATLVLVGKP